MWPYWVWLTSLQLEVWLRPFSFNCMDNLLKSYPRTRAATCRTWCNCTWGYWQGGTWLKCGGVDSHVTGHFYKVMNDGDHPAIMWQWHLAILLQSEGEVFSSSFKKWCQQLQTSWQNIVTICCVFKTWLRNIILAMGSLPHTNYAGVHSLL